MAEKFRFELVTPERRLVAAEVEAVTAPGEIGEFGVLPGHRPLLALLKAGVLTYVTADNPERPVESLKVERVAISGGYAEVSETGVRVLVETAEPAGEIDPARAEAALKKAEEQLSELDPVAQAGELAQAVAARDRAQARLLAVKRV